MVSPVTAAPVLDNDDASEPVRVIVGDSRVVLDTLDADSLDAVVTDPPYDLAFMGKRWDATGIAFDPEFWRKVLRVAKPGAHLVAFGGTRTFHRMTCAIEDAGWEIRDSIGFTYENPLAALERELRSEWSGMSEVERTLAERMLAAVAAQGGPHAWNYATGFPKGRDVYRNDIIPTVEARLREQGVSGPIVWR